MDKIPFYTDIAAFYDEIFPLNQAMVNFVLKNTSETDAKKFIDIGCGSGSLIYALQDYFAGLVGLEPDPAMLELARNQLRSDCSRIKFAKLGMLDLTSFVAESGFSFDVATIVGNTLVHLEGLEQIKECFGQLRRILKEGACFIFQIINYDRIFRTGDFFLPTIETKNCRFERLYEKQAGSEQLIFHTKLQICASGQILENRIPLYPLRFVELNKALKEAGFANVSYFGNFVGEPFCDDSVPLVGIAT